MDMFQKLKKFAYYNKHYYLKFTGEKEVKSIDY